MENRTEQNRIAYLDYLRVFATVAVVLLHMASQNWHAGPAASLSWNVFNAYDSLARWGVPVFVMISGALFLPRDIPIKKLYAKYVLKIVIAYLVWSAFYALTKPLTEPGCEMTVRSVLSDIISGTGYLWFLPMIAGIYICIPILKTIAQNRNIAKYFLAVSFVFAFVLPEVTNIINNFIGGDLVRGMKLVNGVISDMRMHLVLGFPFYFIAGYLLANTEFSAKQRRVIYIAGIAGFLVTVVLTLLNYLKNGSANGNYYDNFSVNVCAEAFAVFVFCKFNLNAPSRFVAKLSKYSFGAYLIHIFVRNMLDVWGVDTMLFNPILSVPILTILVAAVSFALSAVINQIPVLKKYIV